MLIYDLTLLLDLFGNSEGIKLLIWTVIFCLAFTAPAKWRVELWAKIGHYRNRCFISLHPLLWMNVVLDFICMGFVELRATGNKQKIKNGNICIHRESNWRPLAFQRGSNHSATLTINDMLLKLLHYFGISANSCSNSCMKWILVSCVLELTVRQNLHFFYQCRCYLLLLT